MENSMHITWETDYAIRIVDCLARSRERLCAQVISEKNGVTLRFSLKILSKLVAGGLVRSYKGAHGGYEIAKPLEDISLNDIVETIEGPYQLSRCLGDAHACERNDESKCPYHRHFSRLSQQVRAELSAITLASILAEQGAAF